MKKIVVLGLLALSVLLLAAPAAAQEGETCNFGHSCWWSIFDRNYNLIDHGPQVEGLPSDVICAATWFEMSLFINTHEEVSLQVWGGQCPGGAVVALHLGDVRFLAHTGLQGIGSVDPGNPPRNGWLGNPTGPWGVYYYIP